MIVKYPQYLTCYKELNLNPSLVETSKLCFLNCVDSLTRGNAQSEAILTVAMKGVGTEPLGVVLIKSILSHYSTMLRGEQPLPQAAAVRRKKMVKDRMIENFVIRLRSEYGLTSEFTKKLRGTIHYLFSVKVISIKHVVWSGDEIVAIRSPPAQAVEVILDLINVRQCR